MFVFYENATYILSHIFGSITINTGFKLSLFQGGEFIQLFSAKQYEAGDGLWAIRRIERRSAGRLQQTYIGKLITWQYKLYFANM